MASPRAIKAAPSARTKSSAQLIGLTAPTRVSTAVGVGENGFVFVCSTATQRECASLRLFGSPPRDLQQMKDRITPETMMFLVNFDTNKLIGPFAATSESNRDIVKDAFGGRFSAQVRVGPSTKCILPLECVLSRKPKPGAKTSAEAQELLEELMASFTEAVDMESFTEGLVSEPLAKRARLKVDNCAGAASDAASDTRGREGIGWAAHLAATVDEPIESERTRLGSPMDNESNLGKCFEICGEDGEVAGESGSLFDESDVVDWLAPEALEN